MAKKLITCVVAVHRLNVRTEPDGAIVDIVKKDEHLKIVAKKKGWYKVTGSVSGWVDSQYVEVKEAADAE
jgi:hypothetical protein